MDPWLVGVVALILLLALLMLGMPIAYTFAVAGFLGLWWIIGLNSTIATLKSLAYYQVAEYSWAVFPLFIVMGVLAGEGGLTGDAFGATEKWLGRFRGGLAFATTAAGSLFGAVCGSSMAASVTMAKVAWPEMRKAKYNPALSLGSILCAGSLSLLIPPSIGFVFYAMLADESVGRLFIGGIIPGIVLALMMIITVQIWIMIDPKAAPVGIKVPWSEKTKALQGTWAILLLIIVVMGGLWGGVFTANEAAGIGAAGTMAIAMVKKRLTWRGTIQVFTVAAVMSANIFLLLVCVQIFSNFLTVTNLPTMLANWVISMNLSAMMVVIVILFVYAVLGVPLEFAPILMLTLPIFLPVLEGVGIDKVWFGILATFTAALAGITPPVGGPIFLVHGIVKKDGISLNTVFNGCWVFCIPTVVALVACLIWPQLVLWLPGTMFGK